jgi:hypothetical protein
VTDASICPWATARLSNAAGRSNSVSLAGVKVTLIVPGPMNGAIAAPSVKVALLAPWPEPSKNTVSPAPTPPGKRPLAASNPLAQSAAPLLDPS